MAKVLLVVGFEAKTMSMSATYEANIKKKRIKRMEQDWQKRRYEKSAQDIDVMTKRQRTTEANWRKRRKETGTTGDQITLGWALE